MRETNKTHRDLEVYQMAFEAAMRVFELTKRFPKEEIYALTDQSGVLRVRSVRIRPKPGGNEGMRQHSSVS